MSRELKNQAEAFARAVNKLEQLRRYNGAPGPFWNGLIESMSLLCGAQFGVLLRKTAGQTGGMIADMGERRRIDANECGREESHDRQFESDGMAHLVPHGRTSMAVRELAVYRLPRAVFQSNSMKTFPSCANGVPFDLPISVRQTTIGL